MAAAPRRAAVSTPAARLSEKSSLASTRSSLQAGHVAEAAWRSRSISPPHPTLPEGYPPALPAWFTLRKQPFAVVQAGSPTALRYAPRSLSALGLSKESTMAIVLPDPAAPPGRA